MDDNALDWLFYALALLVFIVISTIESRRAQRREARARETAARPPATAAADDPHAWGRMGIPSEVPAGGLPNVPPEVDVPRVTPSMLAPRRGAAWRRRMRNRPQLRDAVVMMTLLGPCASLKGRRGPPHDPP